MTGVQTCALPISWYLACESFSLINSSTQFVTSLRQAGTHLFCRFLLAPKAWVGVSFKSRGLHSFQKTLRAPPLRTRGFFILCRSPSTHYSIGHRYHDDSHHSCFAVRLPLDIQCYGIAKRGQHQYKKGNDAKRFFNLA